MYEGGEDSWNSIQQSIQNLLQPQQKRSQLHQQQPQQQLPPLTHCALLNESICEATSDVLANASAVVVVVVYNPLTTTRNELIRLPVPTQALEGNSSCSHGRRAIVK